MILPSHEHAIVDEVEVVEYLLNPDHLEGAGKAAFYLGCGFSADAWEALASAMLAMAATTHVARTFTTVHGSKYVIEGRLETPCGRTPLVRSVWIVDLGNTVPRLVTAYPLDGE